MSAMTVERIPIVDRDSWLAMRRQDVTASTVAALFGELHPYQTIASLHAEKSGLDLPGPDPESSVIRRGNALETVVAAEVGKQRPEWRIVKNNEYLRDPHARLGATPDFWIEGDPRGRGILECKTVGHSQFKKKWLVGETPTPPLWIILQTLTGAMLGDAAFAAIGVLIVGDYVFDAHVIEISRHAATEHKIRIATKYFWEALEAGQMPELDYERDADFVRLMYPHTAEGKVADLRGDNRIIELLENRELQASIEKEAKTRRAEAETELRSKIGNAEIAMVDGWRVSLKSQTIQAHNVRESNFRVLRTSRETAT